MESIQRSLGSVGRSHEMAGTADSRKRPRDWRALDRGVLEQSRRRTWRQACIDTAGSSGIDQALYRMVGIAS